MRHQVFEDFDAFAAAVRDVDSKMMLCNPEHRVWQISAVDLEGIDLQWGQLGSGNIAQGELRADGFMLYLPMTEGIEYKANGTELDKTSFAVLEPGSEFCVSTKTEHVWCAIFIPNHLIPRDGEALESVSRTNSVWVSNKHAQLADRFRSATRKILDAAARFPQFETSPSARSAKAELLSIAQGVFARNSASQHDGRPRIPREEIIGLCQRLLEQCDGERVCVAELAAAADVSERTLRNAFNDFFGMGPVQYLRLRNLHQIRRALLAANPDGSTVTDVLIRNGEWEFSRFARRYRRLFGELPSETLRR